MTIQIPHKQDGTHILTLQAIVVTLKNPVIFVRVEMKNMQLKVLSHTTNHKNHYFTTTTLKFGLAKCSIFISQVCIHPTSPRHPAPGTTWHDNQIREPGTPTRDVSIPRYQNKTVYQTETMSRSIHKGPRTRPEHYYREFCGQKEQDRAFPG